MSSINILGDSLAVVLNSTNGFSTKNSANLNPPIENQKYFRILSNHVVEIYCSFAATTATVDANGDITEDKRIVAGLKDVWYKCNDFSISYPLIYLSRPSSSGFDSIDLVFQFVKFIPTDYIYNI